MSDSKDNKELDVEKIANGSEEEKLLCAQLRKQVMEGIDDSIICRAVEANPEYVAFILAATLRFRRYDMPTAAVRLTNYLGWSKEMFGEGMLQFQTIQPGEEKSSKTYSIMSEGLLRVMPHLDAQGRAVMTVQIRKMKPSLYSADDMLRAWHCALMSALYRFPAAQTNGVVVVGDLAGAGFSNLDKQVPARMAKAISNNVPVRMANMFMCNPIFLTRIVFPIIKVFMSKKLQKRLNIVNDFDSLYKDFGISRDVLPVDFEGTLDFNSETWAKSFVTSSGSW